MVEARGGYSLIQNIINIYLMILGFNKFHTLY